MVVLLKRSKASTVLSDDYNNANSSHLVVIDYKGVNELQGV